MNRGYLFDFFTGNLPQRTVLSTLVPLIFVFYFGTLLFAIWVFPGDYDWRSSVISNLLSPRHNPEFHWFASLGLSLTGLLSIPFGGYIGNRLRPASRLGANIGMTFFTGGFVVLSLAAVIVTRRSHPIVGILGIHEILARTSALGLGVGIICFSWCAWRGCSIDRKLYSRKLVFSWSALTFLALLAVAGSIGSLLIPRSGTSQLSSVYQLLKHSPFWHLAFWEWIGSVAVFLFLMSAALFLPKGLEGSVPFDAQGNQGRSSFTSESL
jgi:hypothetical protein